MSIRRLAAIQWGQRPVTGFDQFAAQAEIVLAEAADQGMKAVCLPEWFSLQLLTAEKRLPDPEQLPALARHAGAIDALFAGLAQRHKMLVIAGSHPVLGQDGRMHNVAGVHFPDGATRHQAKLHPTPGEKANWSVSGGAGVEIMEWDGVKFATLICYDIEFPELARRAADLGARIIFVPFLTWNRQGYWRVRHCAAARAVENLCAVVMAGSSVMQPGVNGIISTWSQSAILTPCDHGWPPGGIAAEAAAGQEGMISADIDFARLEALRQTGSVRTLMDRRADLYQLDWKGG